jgi:hypothetical protein
MPGLGRKVFTAGDVLTASDVQNYLMDQTTMVFAGTAARSSAISTPTTGMTSYIGVTGTASIPQIEVYTGAAWQVPYGMSLLSSVSITSVASISINNVFTSAFRNYRILVNTAATGVSCINEMRLRASGTDDSNTVYDLQNNGRTGTTNYGALASGSTVWNFGIGSRKLFVSTIDLFSPNVSSPTYGIFNSLHGDTNLANTGATLGVIDHRNNYQADGFTLFFTDSTATGTVRVYGLRD